MRAMVYRGPYKIRVEEKDVPPIEHPNDAIVRVTLVHQPLDLLIVAGPWVGAGAAAYAGLRRLRAAVRRGD
ncbi:MAG: hypothetical protein ACRD1D_01210 [Acidimicrobiales bacterium]